MRIRNREVYIDIRPTALSANAYDDNAYSSKKGAITYGIFSITRTRRRISGISRRARRTGRARVSGRGARRVSRRRAWRIPGDTGRCTRRRSSANVATPAIRTAIAGRHLCHRSRRDQTLPVSQHLRLAEQRRAILVLPGFRRAEFHCRVPMVWVLLGVLRHRFESDSLVHVLLKPGNEREQPEGCSLCFLRLIFLTMMKLMLSRRLMRRLFRLYEEDPFASEKPLDLAFMMFIMPYKFGD